MEFNNAVVTSPPRAASSVILLRNHAGSGLQVLMLRRHSKSAVLAGAYVFPGGKLDPADSQLPELYLDQSVAGLPALLGEPNLPSDQAKGLFVAALREVFEECGVWLAQRPGVTEPELQAMQSRVRNGLHLTDLVLESNLTFQTRTLTPFTRWITPQLSTVMNQRFDTRFFLAVVPEGQHAVHDNIETTDSVWLNPTQALHDYWNGHIDLAPPQIMSLVQLARYGDMNQALVAAAGRLPPTIMPEPFDDEHGRAICYPGDPCHSQPHAVMPGPSRLRFVKGRFEPAGGLADFFS